MKIVLLYLMCYGIRQIFCVETIVEVLPVSDNQINDLADEVCDRLFNGKLIKRCQNNFLSQRITRSDEIKGLTVRCRSEKTVTVEVTPSKLWQLITLFDPNNHLDNIEYGIVKPKDKYVTIHAPTGNYSFWITTLDETGVPSPWTKGPDLKPWKNVEYPENNAYDIKIKYSSTFYRNRYLSQANITWNALNSTDICFQALHYCHKDTQGNLIFKRIKPQDQRMMNVKNLPLNDTCVFKIIGMFGQKNLTYKTPSCDDFSDCIPLPELRNVTVDTTNDDELWAVRVSWLPARSNSAVYNVTLRTATETRSFTFTGNKTEVLFKRVSGEGAYDISIIASNEVGKRLTTKTGFFPIRESSNSVVLIGAWSAAVLVLLALLSAGAYWRRRSTSSDLDLRDIFDKMSLAGDVELSSECEDQWEMRPERLLLHEVIGEGAFGVVRRGTLAPANKDVAVKMLKGFPSVDEMRSFRAEMELMKSVGAHAHVVSLLGCCSGRRPLIVAEYCSRGDLLSYLRCAWDMMISRRNMKYYNNNKEGIYRNYVIKSKPETKGVSNRLYDLEGADTELTYRDLLSFCRQIAMGMEFLASNRVVHRDLAARNVLVTADRTLKIADFGLSRDVYQENQYKQEGNGKLPVKWMALESLTHRIYTTQSDVWSFGVVVWEVVTVGGAPYAGVGAARLPRLLRAGYRMPRPLNCDPQLYDVMLSCWRAGARSRPTFAQLHARLDELLCASADHYLALHDDERPAGVAGYMRMLIRGRWKRTKSYERPLAATTNHYTEQPVQARTALVDIL